VFFAGCNMSHEVSAKCVLDETCFVLDVAASFAVSPHLRSQIVVETFDASDLLSH
jgi:hypothetical protein